MTNHGRVPLHCATCGHLVAEVHPPAPPVPTTCVQCRRADDGHPTVTPIESVDVPDLAVSMGISVYDNAPDDREVGLSLSGNVDHVMDLDQARAFLRAYAAAVDKLELATAVLA